MSQLVLRPPAKDEPGFLRRSRQALQFNEMLQDKPTVAALDAMIEFLLGYVEEPADKEEARELLLDASELQFMEMLNAITGEGEADPT